MPEVEYAEPNFVVTKADVTDSSGGVPVYSLSEVQEMSSSGNPMTQAPIQQTNSWPLLTSNLAKSVIAIIDTGLDFSHPAFANAIWTNPGEIPGNGIDDDQDGFVDDVHGWNFAYGNNTPQDDEGHGTHVSGIVLGMGQNIFQTPAPATSNIAIMPLKFLDSTGSGSTSDAISAIYYAVDKGAKVLNNSWGGGSYSQALAEAIAYAYSQDVLFVAAAGNATNNNDTNPSYPASYQIPNVVAVAASDNTDVIASFSNYGTQSVPLSAPGVNVLSTYPGGQYATMSGTSMATPFVAGAAALMRYQNPHMNSYQIKQLIMSSANSVNDLQPYVSTSARLNVLNSVQAAISTPVNNYMPAFVLTANPGNQNMDNSLDDRGGGCGMVAVLGKGKWKNNDPRGRLQQVVVSLALLLIPVFMVQALRRRKLTPAQRRKHERFLIDSAVTFKVGDQELVGAVKTISVGGSDLNTEALLKDGSIITMSIASPDGTSQIQVQGHIVWSEKQKRYGVAFDSVSEGIKAQIMEWQKGLKSAA